MIKPGTLCLVIKCGLYPERAGWCCEFVRYVTHDHGGGLITDCEIFYRDFPSKHSSGRWAAHSAHLLPIQGDPDTILQFEVEREHV